jgi:hypothetical protein
MEEYNIEDILRVFNMVRADNVYDTFKLYGYDNNTFNINDYEMFFSRAAIPKNFSRAAIPKKQPSTLKNGLPVNWDNEEV